MDQKIRKFYQLKRVYRMNTIESRKESSAEHSWSCLILADYFLNRIKTNIDRLHVYELLMYHDVVEIEAGDIPIHHERKDKYNKEMRAMEKLKNKFPDELKGKFVKLFTEFEDQKSVEARFAKAIDKLDATVHELDCKKDWKGWTEEKVRRYNDLYFAEFPVMKQFHDELLKFVKKEGYFYG